MRETSRPYVPSTDAVASSVIPRSSISSAWILFQTLADSLRPFACSPRSALRSAALSFNRLNRLACFILRCRSKLDPQRKGLRSNPPGQSTSEFGRRRN
jgi:hypothetical protein